MKPGALLLKRLRATKVARVDCSLSRAGILQIRIMLVTSGGHPLPDEQVTVHGAGPSPLLRAFGIASDRTLTKSMFAELRRIRTEATAELAANLIYTAHKERQRRIQDEKLRKRRASNLADSAVYDGVTRDDLLKLVHDAFQLATISHVMES